MIPWKLLSTTEVPGDGGKLCLHQRGNEFSIRINNAELMNSRAHGSEEALAELACKNISARQSPSILIGGLGMGYTLSAVLKNIGTDSKIVVAELVPKVAEWNRGPLAGLADNPLKDGRVSVQITDVGKILQKQTQTYNAILLDVDNGPDGLTRKDNNWLYSPAGLDAAFNTLKTSGVLAVWSAAPDNAFTRRLKHAGFSVKEVRTRARKSGKGGWHTIWIASRNN